MKSACEDSAAPVCSAVFVSFSLERREPGPCRQQCHCTLPWSPRHTGASPALLHMPCSPVAHPMPTRLRTVSLSNSANVKQTGTVGMSP